MPQSQPLKLHMLFSFHRPLCSAPCYRPQQYRLVLVPSIQVCNSFVIPTPPQRIQYPSRWPRLCGLISSRSLPLPLQVGLHPRLPGFAVSCNLHFHHPTSGTYRFSEIRSRMCFWLDLSLSTVMHHEVLLPPLCHLNPEVGYIY